MKIYASLELQKCLKVPLVYSQFFSNTTEREVANCAPPSVSFCFVYFRVCSFFTFLVRRHKPEAAQTGKRVQSVTFPVHFQPQPNSKYKTSMCRDLRLQGGCPRGSSCTFAHTQDELEK